MNKRKQYISFFLFFAVISVVLILLSFAGVLGGARSIVESATQKGSSGVFSLSRTFSSPEKHKLQEEKNNLQSQLLKENLLRKDNAALYDQFQSSSISTSILIPARVIGAPHFFPGENDIETLILDKGKKDGVISGQGVIVKNTLVGKITTVSENISTVIVTTNTHMVLNAKDLRSGAIGIVDGDGNGNLVLGNVLLSEDIKNGDTVVTYGGIDENGKGILPDLLIGVIVSVDKKPSALFQTASVKDMMKVSGFSIVFITTPKK